VARGADPATVDLPELKKRIHRPSQLVVTEPENIPARSDVAGDNEVPVPPFWGTRIVKGVALGDYAAFLDERATFMGQWGLKPGRGDDGASYEQLVDTEGRPRLRYWLDRILAEGIADASVIYGYFPVVSDGNDVIVRHHGDDPHGLLGAQGVLAPDGGSGGELGTERLRFTFPRQSRDRHLCLADFVSSGDSGRTDVLPLQLATFGDRISAVTAELFAADSYRDYMELNGLAMQLTEALAEFWHKRMRQELGIAGDDSPRIKELFTQHYQGSRYSFGYPACPNMADQEKLFALLDPGRIGCVLTENHQIDPEQSTSAIIVHHREAKYFNA